MTPRRRKSEPRPSEQPPPGGTANQPGAEADPLRDASRGRRLHKVMAEAGLASRRACEQLVEEGRVAVNGRTITALPVWVDPSRDRITLDDRPVAAHRPPGATYLMLNKPRRVLCTNSDPEGRRRVLDLVPHRQHLFCVGRLDAESTGLVLLTDDGDLAHRLTHPRYQVPKTYSVTIKGSLDEAGVEKLRRGMILADEAGTKTARARAADVQILRRDRDRTRLRITLREGRNREIRRMLARLGHRVHRLQRTAIGPLRLKGLASGEWRRLTRQETRALRETTGLQGGGSSSSDASRKSGSRRSRSNPGKSTPSRTGKPSRTGRRPSKPRAADKKRSRTK